MAASIHVVTDITTVITNGPSATTASNAMSVSNKIQDYVGNLQSIKLSMREIQNKLALVVADTDAGDANLATLQNIQLTFS